MFPADPTRVFYMSPMQHSILPRRLQTPVMVLSDLDIGMNDWMVPEFDVGRRVTCLIVARSFGAEELEEMDRISSLPRCRRRRNSVPKRCPACTPEKGSYFHARVGPYEVRCVHRRLSCLPGRCRPAAGEVGNRAFDSVPAPEIEYSKFNKIGDSDSRQWPRSMSKKRWTACPSAERHRSQLLPSSRGFPFNEADARSSSRSTSCLRSRTKTAMHSCVALLMLDIDGPDQTGFVTCTTTEIPINAGFVVDGIKYSRKSPRPGRPAAIVSYISKPERSSHPVLPREQTACRPDATRLRRNGFDAVRRLRSRFGDCGNHSGRIRPQRRAAHAGQNERHRLFVENTGVFRQSVARL